MDTDYFLFLLLFCCRDDDWSNDESDSDFDNTHKHDEYSHSEIINRCNFGSKHLINARLSSQTCLQHQDQADSRENCINAVIILNNEHHFKEDPEYGRMLKRMWSGDLTKDDRVRINSRVIGTSGVELPPDFEGKQIKTEFSKLEKTVLTNAI